MDKYAPSSHLTYHLADLVGWTSTLFRLPDPGDRLPLTLRSFVSILLPAYVVHYVAAVLVLIPHTQLLRLSVLPPLAYLAFRAGTHVDLSMGIEGAEQNNYGHCVFMAAMVLRSLDWALCTKPLRRNRVEGTKRNVLWDAGDLVFNMRGIGWTWSEGLYVPPETRSTESRGAFVFGTLLRFLRDLVWLDIAQHAIEARQGGTRASIIRSDLPFILRYLYSTYVVALVGLFVHFCVTVEYYFFTLVAFCIPGFNPDPLNWPPLCEGPWRATSVSDFWGRRWHQTFRRPFMQTAARPLTFLFGKWAGVFGVFILSGILHDSCIWALGKGTDFPRIGGFFILNGVGILLEQGWKRLTGRKVGGVFGRAWTFVWVLGTGHILMDAWLSRGMAGGIQVPDVARPGKQLMQWALRHRDQN